MLPCAEGTERGDGFCQAAGGTKGNSSGCVESTGYVKDCEMANRWCFCSGRSRFRLYWFPGHIGPFSCSH